jgi:hypothetical protein
VSADGLRPAALARGGSKGPFQGPFLNKTALVLLLACAAAAGCGRRSLGDLHDDAASDHSGGSDASDGAADMRSDGGPDRPDAIDASSDATADAGADAGIDAPPAVKTADELAWEPVPRNSAARITVAAFGASYVYVGFSDGELFFDVSSASPHWSELDQPSRPGAPALPPLPVTALAVDEKENPPFVFAGFAGGAASDGGSGAGAKLWLSQGGGQYWSQATLPTSDDVWGVSVSPFNDAQVVAVTSSGPYVSYDHGSSWFSYGNGDANVNFNGQIRAFAEGVGPGPDSGATNRRAWLGDSTGGVYFVDNLDAIADPSRVVWTKVTAPFPARPVASIVVARPDRTQVWVTFAGPGNDGVWFSTDDGATWTNRQRRMLPASSAADPTATFTAASPSPFFPITYLSALAGSGATAPFWSPDAGQSWWLQ